MTGWRLAGLAAALLGALAGCGSSPKPTLYTLSDGLRPAAAAPAGTSIAVMTATVPEVHDRPQMVVRQPGNRVQVLDQQRWAEPLRQEISRLVAADLGQQLGSGSVVALPEDVQTLNPDYKLLLDVQRIDASLDGGVGVDVAWRLVARDGKATPGRSQHQEALGASGDAAYAALATAYRRVFGRVAGDVATAVKGLK